MDGASEAFHLGDIAVATDQELDFVVHLGGGRDEGVRHRQRFGTGSQASGAVAHRHIDGNNAGDEVGEETGHMFLVVMSESRTGENLGIGDNRDEQAVRSEQISNRLIGSAVQVVRAIEKTNDHA